MEKQNINKNGDLEFIDCGPPTIKRELEDDENLKTKNENSSESPFKSELVILKEEVEEINIDDQQLNTSIEGGDGSEPEADGWAPLSCEVQIDEVDANLTFRNESDFNALQVSVGETLSNKQSADRKKSKSTVTKTKNFVCSKCGKAYGSALWLEKHTKNLCKVGKVRKVGKEREEGHRCVWCEVQFKSKLELKQHEKIGCNPRPLSKKAPRSKERFLKLCEYCGREFNENSHFWKHLAKHRNLRCHKCPVCGKGFNKADERKRHVSFVHEKARPWLNCSRCGFRTLSKNHMVAHEKVHDMPEGAEIPLPFLCHCGRGFISQYKLSMHMNYHHKPKKCNICGKTVNNTKSLTQHKLHEHNFSYFKSGDAEKAKAAVKTSQGCPICGRTFSVITALGYHLEVRHGVGNVGLDRFQCECGKTYKSLASFVFHKGSAHGVEVTEAELRTLARPVAAKKGVKHECDQCDKKYDTRLGLQVHVFKHHNMPATGLSCEACDISFQTRAEYYNHKYSAVHAPAEKVTCKICHKRFKDGNNLWAHKIVHSKTPKISCHQCGSKFRRKADYNRHLRDKHGGSDDSS